MPAYSIEENLPASFNTIIEAARTKNAILLTKVMVIDETYPFVIPGKGVATLSAAGVLAYYSAQHKRPADEEAAMWLWLEHGAKRSFIAQGYVLGNQERKAFDLVSRGLKFFTLLPALAQSISHNLGAIDGFVRRYCTIGQEDYPWLVGILNAIAGAATSLPVGFTDYLVESTRLTVPRLSKVDIFSAVTEGLAKVGNWEYLYGSATDRSISRVGFSLAKNAAAQGAAYCRQQGVLEVCNIEGNQNSILYGAGRSGDTSWINQQIEDILDVTPTHPLIKAVYGAIDAGHWQLMLQLCNHSKIKREVKFADLHNKIKEARHLKWADCFEKNIMRDAR